MFYTHVVGLFEKHSTQYFDMIYKTFVFFDTAPVSTGRRFNVVTTLLQRCYNVKTTSCAYGSA